MNKKDIIISILAITSISGIASHYISFAQIKSVVFKNQSISKDEHNHDKVSDVKVSASPLVEKELYTCPMHPSVISDHPGACPVC
ncbi:MAG: heavy metal-binding domain-containing protein, partial [Candidatus Sericytochromatia bacterium]